MMTNLSWSAVIFAALAVLACWNRESRPGCEATRHLYGTRPCCDKHRAKSSKAKYSSVAEYEAIRRAEYATK